jgi:phosphotransacetylase
MKFIDTVFTKLKRHPKRIVFPEGTEPRVLRAAARFVRLKLGAPSCSGSAREIERAPLRKAWILITSIIEPAVSDELDLRQTARSVEAIS